MTEIHHARKETVSQDRYAASGDSVRRNGKIQIAVPTMGKSLIVYIEIYFRKVVREKVKRREEIS
jgi:hypothetical protein